MDGLPSVLDLDDRYTYKRLDDSISAFYKAAEQLHFADVELGEGVQWGGDKKGADGKIITRRRRGSLAGATQLASEKAEQQVFSTLLICAITHSLC